MKAKSLFMFETTYNYHEEDFFNPGCNPVRKEHETFFNTLESPPQIIFMTQSVSESHTIQKERKERGPYFTGWDIQYWVLKSECITISHHFLFSFSVLHGLVTRWRTFKMLLSIYNSFTDPVLRPNVSTLGFFKSCECNPDFSFKRLQCTLHFMKRNKELITRCKNVRKRQRTAWVLFRGSKWAL